MTTTTITELVNPEVNSATAIKLMCERVNTSLSAFTSVEDLPDTDPTLAFATRLTEGRNTGFSNPSHTVTGVFKINATHLTGSTAEFDYEYALDVIARSDQVMTLKHDKFITTTNATGTVNVMLTNYSDNIMVKGDIIKYTMVFREVKP